MTGPYPRLDSQPKPPLTSSLLRSRRSSGSRLSPSTATPGPLPSAGSRLVQGQLMSSCCKNIIFAVRMLWMRQLPGPRGLGGSPSGNLHTGCHQGSLPLVWPFSAGSLLAWSPYLRTVEVGVYPMAGSSLPICMLLVPGLWSSTVCTSMPRRACLRAMPAFWPLWAGIFTCSPIRPWWGLTGILLLTRSLHLAY